MSDSRKTLNHLSIGDRGTVDRVGGARSFRRRLMEMGLVPGTPIKLVNVAPLGDPIEVELRDSRISVRRREAIEVVLASASTGDKLSSLHPTPRSPPLAGEGKS